MTSLLVVKAEEPGVEWQYGIKKGNSKVHLEKVVLPPTNRPLSTLTRQAGTIIMKRADPQVVVLMTMRKEPQKQIVKTL